MKQEKRLLVPAGWRDAPARQPSRPAALRLEAITLRHSNWECLESGPDIWRVDIRMLADRHLSRVS
jgi:hypothetical protein